MKPVARIGDIGKGECIKGHEDVPEGEPKPFITKFATGSGDVYVNNTPVITIGDIGKTDCGHRTKAATGSGTVYVNYKWVHRIGDVGKVIDEGKTYEVATGSGDVYVGD